MAQRSARVLALGITEEVLLERVSPKTLGQLRALHERGALFAMDDFGTGTSGLSQLLALPFDTLLIDRLKDQARRRQRTHSALRHRNNVMCELAHTGGLHTQAGRPKTRRRRAGCSWRAPASAVFRLDSNQSSSPCESRT